MSAKWGEAAKKYRAAEEVQLRQERERVKAEKKAKFAQEAGALQRRADVDLLTAALEKFMCVEGPTAIELLRASKRHIVLAETNCGGGFRHVYFLDGNGLQLSYEPTGTWVVYNKNVPKPKLEPARVGQVAEAATYYGHTKPAELVDWLRSELDKIANAAPAIA